MLTLDKVFNAQTVLKNIIRETNVVRAYGIAPDCELYLKPENLQITGSFKVRGSAYKIAMLSEEEKAKGVVACSAGNHAQGVALAATKNGIKSLICLPDTAPISKVEATKGYGADVCLVEGCYDDAYKKALALRDSEGYTFVHPFDWTALALGVAIVALEFGYVCLYRAGWNISVGTLVANISLACVLLVVGILLYKETVSIKQIIGMVISAIGLFLIVK